MVIPHFERLIRQGAVRDREDLVRLGSVSRTRITEIMLLPNRSPWKQEQLLFAQSGEANERGPRETEEIWAQ